MGYYVMTGVCVACQKVFTFNPHRVPSSSAITGKKEPVCKDCMTRINMKRVELGIAPFEIMSGAYDPVSEEEM
jgi:DNA-directed RNA polymerase subunit RPC12/RpoP